MPAADTKNPGQALEHNQEIKKLDREIKNVDQARQLVHQKLRQLGEAVDAKAKELVSTSQKNSKELQGAKHGTATAGHMRKQLEQLANQLEQLRQQINGLKVSK